jgi:hypothetical protein
VDPTIASWLPTLVFVPLVGFALYRRVRRTGGPSGDDTHQTGTLSFTTLSRQ